MDGMAVLVSNDLEFDVMWIKDQTLDVNLRVAESFLGFRARTVKAMEQTWLVMCHPHAASASAGDRFDHERVADFLGYFDCVFLGFNNPITTWRDRNAGFSRARPRRVLVSHRMHGAGGRTDELDFAAFAHLREMRVLRKEAVAGMDGVDVAHFSRAQDAIDSKITIRAGRGPNAD